MKYPYFALAAGLLAAAPATAQVTDTARTATPSATENFDEFSDASGSASYATQKVLYLTPTKQISLGYEAQLPFDLTTVGPSPRSGTAPTGTEVSTRVN